MVDLGKKYKKTLWGIFISIVWPHRNEYRTYRKMQKNDNEIALNGSSKPNENPERHMTQNQGAIRNYQTTVLYRIKFGLLEEKNKKMY